MHLEEKKGEVFFSFLNPPTPSTHHPSPHQRHFLGWGSGFRLTQQVTAGTAKWKLRGAVSQDHVDTRRGGVGGTGGVEGEVGGVGRGHERPPDCDANSRLGPRRYADERERR